MNGNDGYDGPQATDDTAWSLDALLSPGASAIAAFTLAVLVLMGNNLMVVAAQMLLGQVFSPTSDSQGYFATWGGGAVVPALVSLFLARRALTAGPAAAWELVLARAAVVLAAIGMLYGALTVLGAFLHSY